MGGNGPPIHSARDQPVMVSKHGFKEVILPSVESVKMTSFAFSTRLRYRSSDWRSAILASRKPRWAISNGDSASAKKFSADLLMFLISSGARMLPATVV